LNLKQNGIYLSYGLLNLKQNGIDLSLSNKHGEENKKKLKKQKILRHHSSSKSNWKILETS
jgi:hypothetical protein